MAELEEDWREAEPKEGFGGGLKREKGRGLRVLWGRE